jgi:general secretion pathway protein M
MKEYSLKLKEWWLSLALREKQALALAMALLLIFIAYQWIWSPIAEQASNMRRRIATQEKTLVWMQTADKELQKVEGQSNNKNKASSPIVLLSLMQKRINQAGLDGSLTQLKQATNETIEMHFQKSEFDKLITMLTAVIKQQSASIMQMSVVAGDEPGIVNADVVLKLE